MGAKGAEGEGVGAFGKALTGGIEEERGVAECR